MRDALARADRLERCDQALLLLGGERFVSALEHVLSGGQAAQLGRKIRPVPVDDGHPGILARVAESDYLSGIAVRGECFLVRCMIDAGEKEPR